MYVFTLFRPMEFSIKFDTVKSRWSIVRTVKPVLSSHSNRRPKLVFKTDYGLMQVKSIAACSKGSILQYFRPSLSYHLPLRPLICLFLSGCLRQVLLYWGYNFQKNIIFLSQKINFVFGNNGNHDEMRHYAAFHCDFHCLPKYLSRGFRFQKG